MSSVVDLPGHGTPAWYKGTRTRPGCRCRRCTDAAVRDDQMRVLDRLQGRPRSVPTGPVVAHLELLRSWGMTWGQIGRAAGLSESIARHHMTSGSTTMLRRTAEKLLAVQPGQVGAEGWVGSVGTVRRVRALFALGHSREVLADRLGLSPTGISRLVGGDFTCVRASVAAGARAAYSELSMRVGASTKNRNRAAREGWAPPLAWDDDTIDDPRAVPMLDAETPAAEADPEKAAACWLAGESVVLSPAARRLVIWHLMEWTTGSVDAIAARLEMSSDALSRSWERIKKRERDEGRKAPWRRAYLTPQELGLENELMNNEMERAA